MTLEQFIFAALAVILVISVVGILGVLLYVRGATL